MASVNSSSPAVPPSGGPTAVPWGKQTLTFAKLTIRSQLQNRRTLLFALGFPVILYLLESRMFLTDTGPGSLAVGKAVMAIAFGIFGAFSVALIGFARQLSEDISTKRYRKLRSLPISPSADFVGRFLGCFVGAVFTDAVILVIAALDGARFDAFGPVSVLVILTTLFSFCLVAMAVATLIAILLTGDSVPQISSFVMIIVFFITGFNGMSVSLLPSNLQGIVNYVPNSLAARFQMAYLVGDAARMSSTPLPKGIEYVGLLVLYTVIGAAVATVLVGRFIYAGEVGE
ncbi:MULTISPECIES: ABC transporter permease [unclassified Haladaptatus]|uniref:ABC transporter permease n=1 Tax=unclassified Haladaptatus TaxID=2622732 RepID=UPI00209C6B55|nr:MULTISPECIES: ABC transporter permease [unclassified Haladaptatus]MCO8244339.1 ABC transporter permease [Haladaptatus sp. AB643]MCO8254037.1 ABC transporter permease [Haladaptatus sp. AB618]